MFLTKPDPEDLELRAGGSDLHQRVEIKRKEADGVSPERGLYSSLKACVKAVVEFLFGSRQRSSSKYFPNISSKYCQILVNTFICLVSDHWTMDWAFGCGCLGGTQISSNKPKGLKVAKEDQRSIGSIGF